MIRKILLSASIMLSLYGCSSTGHLGNQFQVKQMMPEDFQKYLDEDTQIKSQISNVIPNEDNLWVDTQKPKCKVHMSPTFMKEDPTVKFYWDGECKDGYAIGLGREFSIGKQTYVEAIGEYEGVKKVPQYFYDFNKANKRFYIGYLSSKPENVLLLEGKLEDTNFFKKSIIFRDDGTKDAYNKFSYDDLGVQGTEYVSFGGLSLVDRSFNADPLLKQQMIIQMKYQKLYSFESYHDGRKLFLDVTSNSPILVNPSQNLQDFIKTKLTFIHNKLNETNDLDLKTFLKSEKKVNTYINLTCTSSEYIKEVGKENYFAICSPYKSLGVFKNQIQQGIELANQQKQRRLEEVNQHLARRQQADQMRQEQQQKNQEGWTALFNTITEVSNGVANSYTQQAEMYRNFSNNLPNQSFPTLNKPKATYNCINIGINTTCRER